jgi:hypothetical protein
MPQAAGQPLGTIGATPARVLRKNAIRIMRTRGVVGRKRSRRRGA